jgi:hypothetical protein
MCFEVHYRLIIFKSVSFLFDFDVDFIISSPFVGKFSFCYLVIFYFKLLFCVKVMDCSFLDFSILINTTAILQAFVILLYLMESSCFSLYLSISSV